MNAITRYLAHELCHHKLIDLVVAVFLGSFSLAYVITQFTVGGHLKILMDYALFSYFFLTLLFPLVCVVPFFARHEEYKLWSFFLTKSISRSKLIGQLLLSFVICLIILGLLFYTAGTFVIWFLTGVWTWFLWPAYVSLALQGIFFISSAQFLALVVQPLIAQLATLCIYCVCYTNHEWVTILHQNGSPMLAHFATVIYYLLPDLHLLDIKNEVIYQLPIHYATVGFSILYSGFFSSLFVCGSLRIFQQKKL